MSDQLNDAVTVLVTLDLPTLCRAARLGGLPIALDEHPLDDVNNSTELLKLFATRGILSAIDESFNRLYPPHYPEDIEYGFWQTDGVAASCFAHIWRGKAKW